MRRVVVKSKQELEICLEIRREVFIDEQHVPEELEVDEYDNLDANVIHILIYDDVNRPVATARLQPYSTAEVKAQRVAVRRSSRGQGYGESTMRVLESFAALQNYRKIVLDAQCHAEPFYTKLGYETVSDKFMEAGIEHVRMEKSLT